MLAVSPTWAQEEDATAREMFERGLSLVEEGELAQAEQLLARVDPVQLQPDDRVRLFETLQSIEQRQAERAQAPQSQASENADGEGEAPAAEDAPASQPTPAELLNRAASIQGEQPSAAAELYREVLTSTEASQEQKAQASAGLAEVRRIVDRELTRARQLLDAAQDDLAKGRQQQAERKLDRLEEMDVELGWFDQQRLDRLRTVLENRRVEAARAETEPADAQAAEMTGANAADEAAEEAAEETLAQAGAETGEGESAAEAAEQAPAETEDPVADARADAQNVDTPDDDTESETPQPEAGRSDLLAEAAMLYAQEKAAEAEQAMEQGQYARAARLYEQALRLDPDNEQYQARLSSAVAARQVGPAPQGLLEDQIVTQRLEAQETRARFEDAIAEARELLRQEEFSEALDAVSRSRRILDNNQRLLGGAYDTLRQEAVALASQITARQEQARLQRIQEAERQQAQQQREQRAQAEAEEAREIEQLLRRAWKLRSELKYEQSLRIIDQVLFMDPNNLAAQFMKESTENSMRAVEARELRRERDVAALDLQLNNLDATIPPSDALEDFVEYPEIWPELTEMRLSGLEENGGDTEANRRTLNRLEERIPVDFDNQRLVAVIDFIRLTAGVDIFVNWPSLETAGIEQDTPITINLQSAPASEVLRLTLQQATATAGNITPIGFTVDEGVVRISTQDDLRSETSIRQYDIRDLLVRVPNFEEAPQFDLDSALPDTEAGTGGGGGGGGGEGLFGDDTDEEDDDQPGRAELIQQITDLIRDTVGRPEDWDLGQSSVSEISGNLIIRTTIDNHREIFELLQQLRETRAIQIAVEARFLLVDENFLEDIGIDLDLAIDPIGDVAGLGGGDIEVEQASRGIASPNPTSLSPAAFFDVSAGSLASSAVNFGISAFLDDIQVDLLVDATQANRRAISLTAPRVTFFNGQRAYVLIVTQQAFVSDLEPVSDAAGFDTTLSVVQEGVVLDVEGTVSADRRYVTLTLRPSLAEIVDIRTIEVFSVVDLDDGDDGDGGDGDDGDSLFDDAVITGTIEAPELQLTEIRTTVSVPDRGTLLTGGQRLVEEIEIEAGVPVLSKIPVLNRFFTNTSTVKDERTLLILVKPTVIIQSELEEQNFPGLQTSPEAFNINRP